MPDLSGAEQACLELAREPLCRGSYHKPSAALVAAYPKLRAG